MGRGRAPVCCCLMTTVWSFTAADGGHRGVRRSRHSDETTTRPTAPPLAAATFQFHARRETNDCDPGGGHRAFRSPTTTTTRVPGQSITSIGVGRRHLVVSVGEKRGSRGGSGGGQDPRGRASRSATDGDVACARSNASRLLMIRINL